MGRSSFNIGKYNIDGDILAPMAGYTDIAFRELCRSFGAGLTVTEMVSVRGLIHDSEKTRLIMRLSDSETPSCIQLFGSDPDDFSRALERGLVESDIIDVNMGCPMPKIVKNGDGSALLKDPELAGRIVAALKNGTDKPITVKTRLGYGMGEDTAAELVESVEKAGASAVTVHGRYAEQRYAGSSDIQKAREIAKNAHIPVIYNGDVKCGGAEIGEPFAAVMIGRAALSDPCIFGERKISRPEVALKHLALLEKYFDDRYAVLQMRKFAVHYFAGMKGGKAARAAINDAKSSDDVKRTVDGLFKMM